MKTPKIFESEYRFCLLLWAHEPIKSGELAALCKEKLGWKPTTTYTVIKRLSERGVLKNENTVVTALVTKEQVQTAELNEMVEKTFEGSLPAFIAAFYRRQTFTDAELDAMQSMIDSYRKGEKP
ncbi:MAG: BlaI/MecI/CopY family transcriptional regulator [Clostridia bacterium]|nr:BlaI/MecI/CopY family transcriptional regulator [Clostridia bacterium]